MGLFSDIKKKIDKKEASGAEYVKWLNETNEDLKKIQSSLSIIINTLKSKDEKDIQKQAKELDHACSHLKNACNKLETKNFWRDFMGTIPDIDDVRVTKDELEGFLIDIKCISEKLEKCEFKEKDELKHILDMRSEQVKNIFYEIRGRYDKFKRILLPF